jgi:hypothetical protein
VKDAGLARLEPLLGVAAVVLWIVGVLVFDSASPGDDATGAEIAAHLDEDSGAILFGASAFAFGSAAFVWFLASLGGRLRQTLGDGRLPSIAMAAGTAMAALTSCLFGPEVAGALTYDNTDRELSPEAAEALDALGDTFFLPAEYMAVAFTAAVAVAILRGGAFPAWFGWLTAFLALVLVIAPLGWAALVFGIPLWTFAVSIWLFLTEDPDATAGRRLPPREIEP